MHSMDAESVAAGLFRAEVIRLMGDRSENAMLDQIRDDWKAVPSLVETGIRICLDGEARTVTLPVFLEVISENCSRGLIMKSLKMGVLAEVAGAGKALMFLMAAKETGMLAHLLCPEHFSWVLATVEDYPDAADFLLAEKAATPFLSWVVFLFWFADLIAWVLQGVTSGFVADVYSHDAKNRLALVAAVLGFGAFVAGSMACQFVL